MKIVNQETFLTAREYMNKEKKELEKLESFNLKMKRHLNTHEYLMELQKYFLSQSFEYAETAKKRELEIVERRMELEGAERINAELIIRKDILTLLDIFGKYACNAKATEKNEEILCKN